MSTSKPSLRHRFEYWNIVAESPDETTYAINGSRYKVPNTLVCRYRETRNKDGTRSGSFELPPEDAEKLGLHF